MSERILGYALLTIGIVVMVLSGLSVYQVFTKKTQPVKLFNFTGINIDLAQMTANQLTNLPPEMSQFINQGSNEKSNAYKTEILPADLINDSSNIFAHLLLMGFIAS
ncbi:MAG: hypothetical protein ACD_77C00126G0001, partial [uncultured bacterium]